MMDSFDTLNDSIKLNMTAICTCSTVKVWSAKEKVRKPDNVLNAVVVEAVLLDVVVTVVATGKVEVSMTGVGAGVDVVVAVVAPGKVEVSVTGVGAGVEVVVTVVATGKVEVSVTGVGAGVSV